MAPDPAEELALWRYHLITEALHPRLGSRERGVISCVQIRNPLHLRLPFWGTKRAPGPGSYHPPQPSSRPRRRAKYAPASPRLLTSSLVRIDETLFFTVARVDPSCCAISRLVQPSATMSSTRCS